MTNRTTLSCICALVIVVTGCLGDDTSTSIGDDGVVDDGSRCDEIENLIPSCDARFAVRVESLNYALADSDGGVPEFFVALSRHDRELDQWLLLGRTDTIEGDYLGAGETARRYTLRWEEIVERGLSALELSGTELRIELWEDDSFLSFKDDLEFRRDGELFTAEEIAAGTAVLTTPQPRSDDNYVLTFTFLPEEEQNLSGQ